MSREDTFKNSEMLSELDWVRIRDEIYENDIEKETIGQRVIRKTKENPLVPIGALGTAAALSYGLWSYYKGDSLMSQYMMRARVAAHSFTILSMVVGFIVISGKNNA